MMCAISGRTYMRLAYQGILLVTLILIVELGFLGYLVSSLDKAQEATGRYEHSMAVITRAQALMKVFIDSSTTLTFYAISRDEVHSKKYDQDIAQIEPDLKALRELVKDEPEGLRTVNKISKLAMEAIDEFTSAKKELDEGEFVNFTRLRKKVMPILPKIMAELQPFIEAQERYSKSLNPEKAKQMRDQVRTFLLYVGIPMNLALALLATGWFMRRITGRLSILSDNTKRLEAGEALKPVLAGSDEISRLDQVFHEMATALRESAKKEKVATDFIKFSEQNLRTITENVPVTLITIDASGTIESVNPRAGELFGYRIDEFWKKNILEFFDLPAQSSQETFVRECAQRTENRPIELNARTKSGGTIPTEVSFKEYETSNGLRFLVTVLDITERHEMERLKREFVAMVSHDLRTPLMTVQGSLSLLAEGALGELPPEATKMATKAEVQIERLRDLVSNLLDLARIESGKFDVRLDEVLLLDVFENSADAVDGLAKERDVKVVVEHTDFEVSADLDRLVQVTTNLLSNAIKFSESGASVALSAVTKDEWIEVRVTDTGRGIPEDQQKSIFSRFEQVSDEDSRKHKGIGLGLSICQAIIEGHGGQIGVESTVGKGSTFWYRVRAVS